MIPLQYINQYLAEVRRRLRFLHVVRDSIIFTASMALLLLVLFLAASALEYLATLRLVGTALILAGGVWIGIHFTIGIRQLTQTTAIARHIGLQRPILSSDLLTAVELQSEAMSENVRFSPAMFQALAKETWYILRRHAPAFYVPSSRLKPAAILMVIAVVCWAVASVSLSNRLRSGARKLFYITASEEGLVASAPQVGDLKLVYHFPSYMGRPTRVVTSSTGHIVAPRGTKIQFSTTALLPIAKANLLVKWQGAEARNQFPFTVSQDYHVQGQLLVMAEGNYYFEFSTLEQRRIIDPVTHQIDLEPDAIPKVTLFAPPNGKEISASHRLELGYVVEDDYGLKQIDLAYQISGKRPERKTLWQASTGAGHSPRNNTGKLDWDIGLLDVPPGSHVFYWIEAVDNDSVSGPKRGTSAIRTVRVYSATSKHQGTLQLHQALVEQILRILAERLLLFEKEPTLSATLQFDKVREVHQEYAALVDGLRELRNYMRQDSFVPRATLRAINGLYQQLSNLLESENNLLKTTEPVRHHHQVKPAHLTSLREHNRQMITEMEQSALLLSNLFDEQRLQSLLTASQEIQHARQRLAELLQTYQKTHDEKLKQEILKYIQHMEKQISDLLTQMTHLRPTIPDEYLNTDAMAQLDIQKELHEVTERLKNGQFEQLANSLQALDTKLKQIQGVLEGNLNDYRQQRMNALEKNYEKLIGQLHSLEKEQREIAEDTYQIIRRYRMRVSQLMQQKIQPFVRQALVKVENLQKKVNEIDGRGLTSYDREQLERIAQRIEDLKGLLDQGDLDESLQIARRASNGLQLLQDDLTDDLDGQSPAKKNYYLRSIQRTRAAQKLALDLLDDLEGILPDPQSLFDTQDRSDLNRLQRQQINLRKQTQKFALQLRSTDKGVPWVDVETFQGLEESSNMMNKALGKLRQMQPQEAHGAEQAAADQLAQLQKQMQMSRRPNAWNMNGASGPREKIEIPGADAFHVPREFRQDILDAMKEKAPDFYQQQVKKYYEELVR